MLVNGNEKRSGLGGTNSCRLATSQTASCRPPETASRTTNVSVNEAAFLLLRQFSHFSVAMKPAMTPTARVCEISPYGSAGAQIRLIDLR